MKTETLIIGGGLSGLALAEMLQASAHDYLLVEARDRVGGRILSKTINGAALDLGPAWFWPGQPRIAKLLERHGLAQFDQFAEGILTYEDQNGVHREQGFASMQGSYRVTGGLGTVVSAMQRSIPSTKIMLGVPIQRLAKGDGFITAATPTVEIKANQVVLALPPRIAAQIEFDPPLPNDARSAMEGVPTWMAGQAKAIAVYDRPLWRDAGLSGHAMSRVGPMVEVHDASPKAGGPYALFGFIGVPPHARRDETYLRKQICAQLGRLFGPDAEQPLSLVIKDWAEDPFTATTADLAPLYAHPQYGLPLSMSDLWNGQLLVAGTEVAPQFGGLLEGALEAAEHAFQMLTTSTSALSNNS